MEVVAEIICHDWEYPGDEQKLPCGAFTIDEVTLSGPPDVIQIKAVSASLSGGLRDTQKTRAWENASLQTVASQIATDNGLEPMYFGEDVQLERRDQRNQSDLAFLNGLANEFGFSCKAHDGKLILFDCESVEAADSCFAIEKTGTMFSPKSYNFKMSGADTDFDKAEIAYTDPKTGKTVKAGAKTAEETAKKEGSEKTLTIQQRAENPAQAQKMARAKLHEKNQDEQTASLEVMGSPQLVAGRVVELSGFEEFSGQWFIKTATHKVSGSGGYATSLELAQGAPTEDGEAGEFVMEEDEGERGESAGETASQKNASANAKAAFEPFIASLPDELRDMEELIICLPEIAAAEAERASDPDWAIAMGYLEAMLIRWLAGAANLDARANKAPFYVDLDWVLRFERARVQYEDLKANILNDKAKALLAKRLASQGKFGDARIDFDFMMVLSD